MIIGYNRLYLIIFHYNPVYPILIAYHAWRDIRPNILFCIHAFAAPGPREPMDLTCLCSGPPGASIVFQLPGPRSPSQIAIMVTK